MDGLEGVTSQDGRDVSGVVNDIFEVSGGMDLYNEIKSTVEGTSIQTADLPLLTTYNKPNALQTHTNDGSIFLVNNGITPDNFINIMLGGFISGEGPENYVFENGSSVSEAMRGSVITQNVFDNFLRANASEIAGGNIPNTYS